MKMRERAFSGTTNPQISEREWKNRKVARKAAADGIVLMKNEGILPLKEGIKLAVFGAGAGCTRKGGTGSGDVCERESISIYHGLLNAGFTVTSEMWIKDYEQRYMQARNAWKDKILTEAGGAEGPAFFQIYANNAFQMPDGREIKKGDFGEAEVCIYVISRIAGEGADRFEKPGDYYLTEKEKEDLQIVTEYSENVIVIINTGGQIDLKDILCHKEVKGLLNVVQPGMEGGNALADILTGKVVPSGKLADTWAKDYADFPNAATFSHNNGNVQTEKYEESIYVGYRYFDSFQIEPEYPFGYGLSYTEFSWQMKQVQATENQVALNIEVKNIGSQYEGKEVVQVYVSCPQLGMPKEFKRLCGFAKTNCLKPQETQCMSIAFDAKNIASFSEEKSAWVLEKGYYGIWIGNSSVNVQLAAALQVEEEVILEKTEHICPLQEELTELLRPEDLAEIREAAWLKELKKHELPVILFAPTEMKKKRIAENELDQLAWELVNQLEDEQLIAMVIGEVSKGHDNALGAAGIMVPGAAGETSSVLEEKYQIPGVSMADGPAGLRLIPKYQADPQKHEVYSQGFLGALEGGFFAPKEEYEGSATYYQYCTAIPVGALLAQTWDVKLLEEVGHAVAEEMQEFGVAWWLAPGMNIHRNPLCGRNFEYYSEDLLHSAMMAAAMTNGVQSVPGTGTTMKHFCCNNQEDNRLGSNSVLSERTLREIYLRNFEIAVKMSQPMAIMSSYNLVNGIHTANHRDLCTKVLREEWDFQGIVMTDWTTTSEEGGSIPWRCAAAGNDLIMPGSVEDSVNIRQALKNGELDREDLKVCVKRMLKIIYQTLGFEGCKCYGDQFRK